MSTDRIKRLRDNSAEVRDIIGEVATEVVQNISAIKEKWLSDNYLRVKGKPIPEDCNSTHLLEWRIIEKTLPNYGTHMTLLHLEKTISLLIINSYDTKVYYTIENYDGTRDSGYADI